MVPEHENVVLCLDCETPACRLWHADVLEWVWFLNAHPEVMYRSMYGDKDTFRLAFHLAGKPEAFAQVAMPPRAVLDATPEDVRSPISLFPLQARGVRAGRHAAPRHA